MWVTLGCLVLLLVATPVWLTLRPVDVPLLTPYLEEALSSDASVSVEIGGTQLRWGGLQRGVMVHAREVRVLAADGSLLARFPAVAVDLWWRALIAGEIAPAEIEIQGAEARVRRGPDGALQSAFLVGPETEVPTADSLGTLIDELLPASSGAGSDLSLRRVAFADAQLRLDGPEGTGELRAASVDVELVRHARRLSLVAALSLEVDGRPGRIDLELSHAQGEETIAAEARFAALVPSTLAALLPELDLDRFGRLELPLSGLLELQLSAQDLTDWDRVRGLRLELRGGEGEIALPAITATVFPIESVEIELHGGTGGEGVEIERARLQLAGGGLTAKIRELPEASRSRFQIEAQLGDFDVKSLARYWGPDVASEVREWVAANITRGRISGANLDLELIAAQGAPLEVAALSGTLQAAGLRVDYFAPMPAATDVKGQIRFDREQADIRVETAKIGDVDVSDAAVAITDLGGDTQLSLAGNVRGPLATLFEILEAPPLELLSGSELELKNIGGRAEGRLELALPLGDKAQAGAIEFSSEGQLRAVQAELGETGLVAEGDSLALTASHAGLELSGDLRVNSAPLTLSWRERFETTPTTELSLGAADTGQLLQGANWSSQLSGGKLALRAQRVAAGDPLSGHLELTNFVVVKANWLLRILQGLTLVSIHRSLLDSGLDFESFQVDFTAQGDALELRNGRAVGSAVGLTLQGQLDLAEGSTDLSGTLAPMGPVNRTLGALPMVGKALTKDGTQGLLAGQYRLRGPLRDPGVEVLPTSTLLSPNTWLGVLQGVSGLDLGESDEPPPVGSAPRAR